MAWTWTVDDWNNNLNKQAKFQKNANKNRGNHSIHFTSFNGTLFEHRKTVHLKIIRSFRRETQSHAKNQFYLSEDVNKCER